MSPVIDLYAAVCFYAWVLEKDAEQVEGEQAFYYLYFTSSLFP